MSPLGYFLTFAIIAALMIGVSLWMAWFSRKAMADHKRQIEDMIGEMRDMMDEKKSGDADKGES